jgi:hypothetical protein
VFIPTGGGYDLKLRNVDNIGKITIDEQGNGDRSQGDLNAVDVGTEVLVPSMPADNLTFRQLAYRQRVGDSSWYEITQVPQRNGQVRIAVTNRSPYELTRNTIFAGSSQQPLPDLKPGETKEVEMEFQGDVNTQNESMGDLGNAAARNRQVLLHGFVLGLRPGPQIGKEVGNRTSIAMIYTEPYEGATR